VQVLFRPAVVQNCGSSLRWSKSSRGRVKCNADATIFTTRESLLQLIHHGFTVYHNLNK
jgi:hypothetical protein